MCLYYKCNLCGSEQSIDRIEQLNTNRNPLGLRAPLALPYDVTGASDKRVICVECDDRFSLVMNEEGKIYRDRLTNRLEKTLAIILEENE